MIDSGTYECYSGTERVVAYFVEVDDGSPIYFFWNYFITYKFGKSEAIIFLKHKMNAKFLCGNVGKAVISSVGVQLFFSQLPEAHKLSSVPVII